MVFLNQKRHPFLFQTWQEGHRCQTASRSREIHRCLWTFGGSHKFHVVSLPRCHCVEWVFTTLGFYEWRPGIQVVCRFAVWPSFQLWFPDCPAYIFPALAWIVRNTHAFDIPRLEFFAITGTYKFNSEWRNPPGTWFRQIIPTGSQLIHLLKEIQNKCIDLNDEAII